MARAVNFYAEFLAFVGLLLMGIGFLAVLPPFEGFDETAHYSSLRQIADTGMLPITGSSFIDKNVIDYRRHGPKSYADPGSYEDRSGFLYFSFFEGADKGDIYRKLYREGRGLPPFTPSSEEINWQAQHPPLYYVFMALAVKVTSAIPFVDQMFVLRLLSFLMAVGGLWIGLRGTLAYWQETLPRSGCMRACFWGYPLMVPMFFPEFARLGNDSLCLLIIGLLWSLMLRWLRDESDMKTTVFLGFGFALGLLTKAFFLPIFAGFVLFQAVRFIRDRKDKALCRARLDRFVVLLAPVVFACFWYVYKFKAYGSFTGSIDFIELDSKGGLWKNLFLNFTFHDFFKREAAFLTTWFWIGTQSFLFMPILTLVPIAALHLWLFAAYGHRLAKTTLAEAGWLPLALIIFVLFGFLYHTLVCVAVGSGGNYTPAWYMSIFAPVLAFAFAWGLRENGRAQRNLLTLALLYNAIFLAVVFWAEMTIFAGYARHGVGTGIYVYPTAAPFGIDGFSTVLNRLDVLGWPRLGLASFSAGLLLLTGSVLRLLHEPPRQSARIPTASFMEGFKGRLVLL